MSKYLSVSLLLSSSAVIFNLWLGAQSSKKGLCHNRLVLGDCSTQKRANARCYIGSIRLFRGDVTENRLFVISGWGVNGDFSIHINTLRQQQPNPTTFVCSVIVVLKAPKSLNIIPYLTGYRGFYLHIFLLFFLQSCKLVYLLVPRSGLNTDLTPVTAKIAGRWTCWFSPVPHCHLVERSPHYMHYNENDLEKTVVFDIKHLLKV